MTGRYLPGSCVVCGQGTDTGLIVKGEGEVHIAFLTQLFDIPQGEAADTVSFGTGRPPGMVPGGIFTATHKVCRACVRRSKVQLPDPAVLHAGASVPMISFRPRKLPRKDEA